MQRLIRFYIPFVFCALLFGGGFAPKAFAQQISSESLLRVQSGIKGSIQQVLGLNSARKSFKDVQALEGFYLARGYKPYWVNKSRVQSNARDFVEILEQSWKHGLNPYSYHLERVYALMEGGDQDALAELEVLLSDAYVRLGQDLTGIRVDPRFMKSHSRYWRAPFTAEYFLGRLGQERDVERLVRSLEPKGKTYARIQEELVRQIRKEPEPYEAVLPIRLGRLLRPMQRHERVPDLRLRLGVEGPQTEDPLLYDDRLAAAVIRFQRENSLKDDGVLGPQTLDILNRSREQKIEQLIANLERIRWVEEDKPEKFVLVNVPSATLWAVEDGRVAFEMPVIVGRKKRPTNIFRAEIHGVRFNPDWTVPPTIKKDDILPKLQEDPEYLTNKGMQLISGVGEAAVTLDPLAFDWENITQEELKDLRMVQVPGAHNPLGQIRVLMPNSYNIYLHDTNEPQYFERASRAASSGCVRMKDPERMANFILQGRKGWDERDLPEVLADGKTHDLFIPEPIPVYMLYYTVWINDQGDLVYGQDLYQFDEDLIKMLKNIDGFLIPVDNT
ncbi:MAG: L,D-transpeptidase family protein [Alphaproteobacteria bacterium]